MGIDLDRRTGGIALLVGYLLMVGLLYRQPVDGLAAAMASFRGIVYFVGFPIAGLAAGVYSLVEGPYNAVFLFGAGNYLAVFGLVLALGVIQGPPRVNVLGVVMIALAIAALFVSFGAFVDYVRLTPAGDT